MDADQARRLEKWAAASFRTMAGGYEGATDLPDAPISAKRLGQAARGEARLSLGEAIWLMANNGRADLLRTLADRIDGGESPAVSLDRLTRSHVYGAADLARAVEQAEADGRYSAAEVHELGQATAERLKEAQDIHDRVLKLRPGPITPEAE